MALLIPRISSGSFLVPKSARMIMAMTIISVVPIFGIYFWSPPFWFSWLLSKSLMAFSISFLAFFSSLLDSPRPLAISGSLLAPKRKKRTISIIMISPEPKLLNIVV